MARERDYAAEYARRVELERERSFAEGRPFDRNRARGRNNPEAVARERYRKQLRYWEAKTRFGIPAGEYRIIVDSSVERWRSVHRVIAQLKVKYANVGKYNGVKDPGPGQVLWRTVYMERESYMPQELFWYHPA